MKRLFVLLCFMASTFLAMANGNESQQTNTTQKVEVQNAEVNSNSLEFAVGTCTIYLLDENGNNIGHVTVNCGFCSDAQACAAAQAAILQMIEKRSLLNINFEMPYSGNNSTFL